MLLNVEQLTLLLQTKNCNCYSRARAGGVFLAKFIQNLSSQVATPLRTLFEQHKEWEWNREHEESFLKLKDLAARAPAVLQKFNQLHFLLMNYT